MVEYAVPEDRDPYRSRGAVIRIRENCNSEDNVTRRDTDSKRNSPNGSLHGSFRNVGDNAEEPLFPIERGSQKRNVGSDATEQQPDKDHEGSSQTRFPSNMDINLSTDKHEKKEFGKHPNRLEIMRDDVGYRLRFLKDNEPDRYHTEKGGYGNSLLKEMLQPGQQDSHCHDKQSAFRRAPVVSLEQTNKRVARNYSHEDSKGYRQRNLSQFCHYIDFFSTVQVQEIS